MEEERLNLLRASIEAQKREIERIFARIGTATRRGDSQSGEPCLSASHPILPF